MLMLYGIFASSQLPTLFFEFLPLFRRDFADLSADCIGLPIELLGFGKPGTTLGFERDDSIDFFGCTTVLAIGFDCFGVF
jgi:hypothetical protein